MLNNSLNNQSNTPIRIQSSFSLNKKSVSPRDYQLDAIRDVVKGFKTQDRGKLIMACRSGKTATSVFISEKLYKKGYKNKVLVVLPSLMLLDQTINEWLRMSSIPLKFGIICSNTKAGTVEDGDITPEELKNKGLGVAQNIKDIKNLLDVSGRVVIFCTYNSLPKISSIYRSKKYKDFTFDFGIADEAHRTATNKKSFFSEFHKDSNIKIKKRLYMTATPRVHGSSSEIAKLTHCMDCEKTFGKNFHVLSFKKAIDKKIIRDYKILTTEIRPEKRQLNKVLNSLSHLELDHHLLDGDIVCSVIATEKTIKERDIRKVFTFFSKIDRAVAFKEVYKLLYPKRKIEVVSSRDSSKERVEKLESFKNGNTQILANAKLLTEGITVGSGDLVVLADGKGSRVEVVQSISRVLNRSKKKSYGYILLPLNNPEEENSAHKTATFENMIRTLRALQDVDEELRSEIKSITKSKDLGQVDSYSSQNKIIFSFNRSRIESGVFVKELNRSFIRSKIQFWSAEKIKKEAKKYDTRSKFQKESNGAYNAARNLGLLDQVCSHMSKRKSWDEKSIKKEAKKYSTRGDFNKESPGAYTAARNLGLLDQVCGHMRSTRKNWSISEIRKLAKKYKNRYDFQRENVAAYTYARKRGLLDDICSHMHKRKVWDEKSIAKEAKKYKTRNAFNKGCSSAYGAALRLGILDSVCSHMQNSLKSWSLPKIKREAKKYKSKDSFQRGSNGAYHAARKLGILDSVCSHMESRKWTAQKIRKEAKKYTSRSKFNKGNVSAYGAARKLGILDSVCEHMEKNTK